MKVKLYHYIHCPYCVRVRLALGFLQVDYDSIVLPYDDEKTPIKLCGAKMLPILQKADGTFMNESLEIISYLDQNKLLSSSLTEEDFKQTEEYLSKISKNIFFLCMPVWVNTPEFTTSAKAYFLQKKEAKRGPFNELYLKRNSLIDQVAVDLEELESMLYPFFLSSEFSTLDIMLASHLWGLFLVPEFQFSDKIYRYLMTVKNLCHFDYHQDYWKPPFYPLKKEDL